MNTTTKPATALTGDRTTGPLHLGHYAGSLATRVRMQDTHDLTIMLADAQALTDNGHDPSRIRDNVLQVTADQIACGIDPSRTTMFVQSAVPAIAQLSMLYLNLVTVARLERNPTVRAEIVQKGMERDIPAGFLCYPAAQAADITAFKATVVPAGEDQAPMVEQSNELARRINRLAGREILPDARILLSSCPRLPGVDGKAKASKSLGNAIALSATATELQTAVRAMYTDENHLRVSDPGMVEGNVVFAYLDAFDPEVGVVEDLKDHYRRGGLGDMALKQRLGAVLETLLGPIRDRRADLIARPDDLMDVLKTGTARARAVAEDTLGEIEDALGLFRF